MNHISHLDPCYDAVFVHRHDRVPHFLAKHSLWNVPIMGRILKGANQIPVYRGTTDAQQSLRAGARGAGDGKIVVIYPEGTITRDPDGWPMHSRTGVARLALQHDGPVIPRRPLGHEGGLRPLRQEVPPAAAHDDHRALRASRSTCPPTAAGRSDSAMLREVTDLLMGAVQELLAEVREEPAPDGLLPGPRKALNTMAMRSGSPCSAPVRGARRSRRCSPTPVPRSCCGRGARTSRRRSPSGRVNPDYLPGVALPASASRPRSDPAKALDGADAVVLAVPSQTLRVNLDGVEGPAAARRRRWSASPRASSSGTLKRMSEVIARGRRRRPRPGRGRVRAEPGQGDRRRAADRDRHRVHGPRPRGRAAVRLLQRLLPAVHQHRRGRLRAGRGVQERDRAGRAAWRRAWASATTRWRR